VTKKYSHSPRLADVRDGARFILDAWFQYSRNGDHQRGPKVVVTLQTDVPLHDIPKWPRADIPGETGSNAVDAAGNRYELYARQGSLAIRERLVDDTRDRYPLWTLPLPDLQDEELFAYVEAFRGTGEFFKGRLDRNDHSDPNCLFVVSALTEKHAVGRMVSWASDTQDDYLEYLEKRKTDASAFPKDYCFHFVENLNCFLDTFVVEGRLALSTFEVRIPRKQLPDAAVAGSLIVGSSFWVNVVNDIEITSVAAAGIAGNVNRHLLDAYLPYRERERPSMVRRSHDGLQLATIQDWLKEAARAKAKLDPDEILLAVLPKDKDSSRYETTSLLAFGSRGAVFFEYEGEWLESIAAGNPDPGLWMYRNARPWSHRSYEGEYDGGIEGDFEPATLEDIAFFGNDPDDLAKELAESYEGADFAASVAAGTFLEDLMRLQREACMPSPEVAQAR
jgi:hypothetical protein